MTRFATLSALLFATLCLTACGGGGDPHEAAVEDMLEVMGDFDTALAEVEDLESAKALGPKLDDINARLNALVKELGELEAPSEEKQKEIEEKYRPQMEQMKADMTEHMQRIGQLGPAVMMEFGKQMEKLSPDEEMPEWMAKP